MLKDRSVAKISVTCAYHVPSLHVPRLVTHIKGDISLQRETVSQSRSVLYFFDRDKGQGMRGRGIISMGARRKGEGRRGGAGS